MDFNAVTLLGIAGVGANDGRFKAVSRKLNRNVTPNEKEAAVAYARTLLSPVIDKVLDRNQLLFWQKKEQVLTADEQNSLASGAYETRDALIYLRRNIPTSGQNDLLTSSQVELFGICSYATQKVKYPFQITGVAIGYGESNAATDNAATVKYLYDDTVPAALQNSSLVVSQTTGGEILRIELSRLFKRSGATGTIGDHIYKLTAPKYLRTDSPVKMQLIAPDGTTITPITSGDFPFLNIEFVGNELGPKASK